MTAQDVQAICSSAVQAAKAWLVACSQAAGLRSSAAAEESASPQMRHYPTAAYPQSAGCIFVCPAHRHRPGIFATVLVNGEQPQLQTSLAQADKEPLLPMRLAVLELLQAPLHLKCCCLFAACIAQVVRGLPSPTDLSACSAANSCLISCSALLIVRLSGIGPSRSMTRISGWVSQQPATLLLCRAGGSDSGLQPFV